MEEVLLENISSHDKDFIKTLDNFKDDFIRFEVIKGTWKLKGFSFKGNIIFLENANNINIPIEENFVRLVESIRTGMRYSIYKPDSTRLVSLGAIKFGKKTLSSIPLDLLDWHRFEQELYTKKIKWGAIIGEKDSEKTYLLVHDGAIFSSYPREGESSFYKEGTIVSILEYEEGKGITLLDFEKEELTQIKNNIKTFSSFVLKAVDVFNAYYGTSGKDFLKACIKKAIQNARDKTKKKIEFDEKTLLIYIEPSLDYVNLLQVLLREFIARTKDYIGNKTGEVVERFKLDLIELPEEMRNPLFEVLIKS